VACLVVNPYVVGANYLYTVGFQGIFYSAASLAGKEAIGNIIAWANCINTIYLQYRTAGNVLVRATGLKSAVTTAGIHYYNTIYANTGIIYTYRVTGKLQVTVKRQGHVYVYRKVIAWQIRVTVVVIVFAARKK
jgi:hypothetical protein